MKKKTATIALVITFIMFIAGLVLIFSAPEYGRKAGYNAINQNGGHMDTAQYELVISSATSSFHTGGFVIALIGGLGMLASGYVLHKEL